MEPEQKENMVLSYITYSFLGIFMLVVAFIIFNETRQNKKVVKYDQDFHIPEMTLLTPEEVEAERNKLLPLADRPKHIQEIEIINSEIEINTITKNDLDSITAQQQTNTNFAPSYIVNLTPEELKSAQASGQTTISKTHPSGVIVVHNIQNEPQKTQFSLEGSIFSINKNKQIITIILQDNNELSDIKVNSNTQVMINGKRMTISDLKIADKIRADGYGVFETKELIDTSTIIVTGYNQIIPTN